jgi:AraC-like DNA-binding protein
MFRSILDPVLDFSDELIETNAGKLGVSIVDLLSIFSCPDRDDVSASRSRLKLRFFEAKSYIDRNLFDPDLTVGAIARRSGVSVRYIQRSFEQEGVCAKAYIRQRRLEASARLLRDPRRRSFSITEIAFRCGFNSSAHFGRQFRARFGLSPRDYRTIHESRAFAWSEETPAPAS